LTCKNQGLCVVNDNDDGANCNDVANGCCDNYCLEAGDCSPTYQGSFTATGCDGKTIVYESCTDPYTSFMKTVSKEIKW
jgi:hypothetical protein